MHCVVTYRVLTSERSLRLQRLQHNNHVMLLPAPDDEAKVICSLVSLSVSLSASLYACTQDYGKKHERILMNFWRWTTAHCPPPKIHQNPFMGPRNNRSDSGGNSDSRFLTRIMISIDQDPVIYLQDSSFVGLLLRIL